MSNDKREQFEAFLKSKSLDNTQSQDAWDQWIYKETHIQAMWEGWQAALSQSEPTREQLAKEIESQVDASKNSVFRSGMKVAANIVRCCEPFVLSEPVQVSQPVAWRVTASVNGDIVRDSLEFTRMSKIDEKVVRKSYDLVIVPLFTAPPDYEALRKQLSHAEQAATVEAKLADEFRAERDVLRQRVAELESDEQHVKEIKQIDSLFAERDRLQSECEVLNAQMDNLFLFLSSDTLAMSYQTLGQYRNELRLMMKEQAK
jgi:hypothetical protein